MTGGDVSEDRGNLFDGIPGQLPEEITETIVAGNALRIERIVSRGHVTPDESWYDQEENEWVLLVTAGPRLRFHDGRVVELAPGDYINIPAHAKHRVEWTDPDTDTVWLAVFY